MELRQELIGGRGEDVLPHYLDRTFEKLDKVAKFRLDTSGLPVLSYEVLSEALGEIRKKEVESFYGTIEELHEFPTDDIGLSRVSRGWVQSFSEIDGKEIPPLAEVWIQSMIQGGEVDPAAVDPENWKRVLHDLSDLCRKCLQADCDLLYGWVVEREPGEEEPAEDSEE